MFFYDSQVFGLSAVFLPYNGYLHLAPRLIALVGSLFDPLWIPTWYVYSSLALTLYVAGRTQSPRLPFPTHAGYALAVALVPDVPDGLMNPTNLQFILVGGLILLLCSRDPSTLREAIHDVVATIILGLTGPFSIVLSPFFLVRAWLRKSPASWILASIVFASGCIQLYLVRAHPVPMAPGLDGPVAWNYVLSPFGARLGGSLFTGIFFWRHPSVLSLNLAGAAVIIIVGYLASRRGNHLLERIAFGACCLLLLASALFRQRTNLPPMSAFGYGSRYFYAPQLLFLWVLLLNLSTGGRTAIMVKIGLSLFLLVNVPRLREPGLQDLHWANYVPQIRAGDAVNIPINPDWNIPLPKLGPPFPH